MNEEIIQLSPGARATEELKKKKVIEDMQKLAAEEQKRLIAIADKLEKLLIKESVTIGELPLITGIVTGKINSKFNKSTIEEWL